MNHRVSFRIQVLATLAMQAAAPLYAANVVQLTLTDAVHLAIRRNRALKIARLKVVEKEHRKTGEHSAYFPEITNESNALRITDLQFVDIPAGRFRQTPRSRSRERSAVRTGRRESPATERGSGRCD